MQHKSFAISLMGAPYRMHGWRSWRNMHRMHACRHAPEPLSMNATGLLTTSTGSLVQE